MLFEFKENPYLASAFTKMHNTEKINVYRFQFNGFTLSSLMKIFNYDKIVLIVLWPQ